MGWIDDYFKNKVRSADVLVSNNIDVTKSLSVKATSVGIVVTKAPVGLYYDENGGLLCIALTVDANTRRGQWGIVALVQDLPLGAIAPGSKVKVIIQGRATVYDESVAGKVITAIANNGNLTEETAGVTNIDTALAVSVESDDPGEIYIY